MPFKKGQSGNPSGRKQGAENKETKTLRKFLADVLDNNQERFEEELLSLEGEKFVNAFANLLEYCTPKLQRTEHHGEITQKQEGVFKIAGQDIPFEKKG